MTAKMRGTQKEAVQSPQEDSFVMGVGGAVTGPRGLVFPGPWPLGRPQSFRCPATSLPSHPGCVNNHNTSRVFFPFSFFLFRAAPVAYGGSQARGRIGAIAADLHHSYSSTRFEPHLQTTPQLMATPGP